jgi:hypothetical protein
MQVLTVERHGCGRFTAIFEILSIWLVYGKRQSIRMGRVGTERMIMKKKLNEKVAKVLLKDLDAKALDAVTGGSTLPTTGGAGCRTCGILVTTGT